MPDVAACRPAWVTTDHDSAYERDIYNDLALSLRYTKALFALHAGAAGGQYGQEG